MRALPTPRRPGPNRPSGSGCPGGSLGADRLVTSTGARPLGACSSLEGRHDVMHELAPDLHLARGGPGHTLNVYLLGDVVVDAGVRWSRRRLAHQLRGRRLAAHVLSHAHFDHAGCSAWLCHTFSLPLWCGAGDATAISSGRVDTYGSPWVNRLQRRLAPVAAHRVTHTLQEGDIIAGFEVLEVPGHSPGALAFWRQQDRVLVCGDVWPTSACTPPGPGWCWRQRRCHGTPRPTGARPVAWPSYDRGWLASGTALRSPTRPFRRRHRPAPVGAVVDLPTYARARGPMCRTRPANTGRPKQPAEPHSARPWTGGSGRVRVAWLR
jgi:hydroxyacylglutathione hydrolase